MKWPYIYLSFLTMLVLGLADNIRGAIFPDFIHEFQLTDSQGSVFFSLASACGLSANLASVWWLKKWGPLLANKISQISMTLGLLLIGYSHTLMGVFLGVVFVGLSFGGTGISQNILIAWGSYEDKRRKLYSGLHAIYGFASLIAPLISALVVRIGGAWRDGFLVIGWVSVAVNVYSFFIKPYSDDPPYPQSSFKQKLLPWKEVIWFSVFVSLYVVAELLVGTRLSLLAQREWGLNQIEASELLSLFYVLLLAGRMMMSFWHFQIKTPKLLLISLIASLLVLSLGIVVHPFIVALSGLCMSVFFPCSLALAYEQYPKAADILIAWTLSFNSLFIMSMHYGVGILSDLYNLKYAFWIGPISLLISIIMLFSRIKKLSPSVPS